MSLSNAYKFNYPALYSRTLVIKLFRSSIKLNFYSNTIRRSVFSYKLRNPHGMPTFKIEALYLVSNVQLVKRLLL